MLKNKNIQPKTYFGSQTRYHLYTFFFFFFAEKTRFKPRLFINHICWIFQLPSWKNGKWQLFSLLFLRSKNFLSVVVILLALNNGPQACIKPANEYYSSRILKIQSSRRIWATCGSARCDSTVFISAICLGKTRNSSQLSLGTIWATIEERSLHVLNKCTQDCVNFNNYNDRLKNRTIRCHSFAR